MDATQMAGRPGREPEEEREHLDDEFLSWVVHEVQTSLTFILFNAQILQD